jgi:hypothetical protein
MIGKLVHVGEKAAREMAEHRDAAFDSAAADTARARGMSDAQIRDIFGYVPPPLFPAKPELEEAVGDSDYGAGRR